MKLAKFHQETRLKCTFMKLQKVPMSSRCVCRVFITLGRLMCLLPPLFLIFLFLYAKTDPKLDLLFSWSHNPAFQPVTYRYGNSSQVFKWKEMRNCTTPPYSQSFLGWELMQELLQRPNGPKLYKRNQHVFVPNYVKAERSFNCEESITFTTQGEFSFLDNLVPIVERWRGPVSVAVYAAGIDFGEAVSRIWYLRKCTSELIKELVTFHMYIPLKFLNETDIKPFEDTNATGSSEQFCSDPPFAAKFGPGQSFRQSRNLTYPVNLLRNLARTQATTHYVMAADIELYPSPNLIPMLLDLINRTNHDKKHKGSKARFTPNTTTVYVPPLFELKASESLPNSKTELLQQLDAGKAVAFHAKICGYCHRVPEYKKWRKAVNNDTARLEALYVTTREGKFDWEPVFVGTNTDPLFHEELTWEGKRNKMTQAYEMCLMGYRYVILDNAFLVHRPGIKTDARINKFMKEQGRQGGRIKKIKANLKAKYGNKTRCLL